MSCKHVIKPRYIDYILDGSIGNTNRIDSTVSKSFFLVERCTWIENWVIHKQLLLSSHSISIDPKFIAFAVNSNEYYRNSNYCQFHSEIEIVMLIRSNEPFFKNLICNYWAHRLTHITNTSGKSLMESRSFTKL